MRIYFRRTSDLNDDMTPRLTTIIFDLGGVLVDWNPRYLYRKIFSDELAMETFLRDICHGGWNEKQDAGRALAEATEELVVLHPDKEVEIRAYYDRWPEMLGGAIEGTVRILEDLKKQGNYRLLALSNWSAETFPIAKERFPFLGIFETVLLSGEEKLIKPDPRFYDLLTSRLGVIPKDAVFIDDVQKNIDAAETFGLNTIWFQSPAQLEKDLRERFGITVSSLH